jgi:hypothetical protein
MCHSIFDNASVAAFIGAIVGGAAGAVGAYIVARRIDSAKDRVGATEALPALLKMNGKIADLRIKSIDILDRSGSAALPIHVTQSFDRGERRRTFSVCHLYLNMDQRLAIGNIQFMMEQADHRNTQLNDYMLKPASVDGKELDRLLNEQKVMLVRVKEICDAYLANKLTEYGLPHSPV